MKLSTINFSLLVFSRVRFSKYYALEIENDESRQHDRSSQQQAGRKKEYTRLDILLLRSINGIGSSAFFSIVIHSDFLIESIFACSFHRLL
jgi:hypothetical protein